MFKGTQIKIILMFFVIGVILITGLDFYYTQTYKEILVTTHSADELYTVTNQKIQEIQKFTIYALSALGIICISAGVFISRSIVAPIKRLVKSAEKIANGESVELIPTNQKKKRRKNDMDELVNAFSIMTSELKQNLNEVTRQKRQIETILLHMSDGIIAFDMEGRIILINPVATRKKTRNK